jgi:hypothetical protein
VLLLVLRCLVKLILHHHLKHHWVLKLASTPLVSTTPSLAIRRVSQTPPARTTPQLAIKRVFRLQLVDTTLRLAHQQVMQ